LANRTANRLRPQTGLFIVVLVVRVVASFRTTCVTFSRLSCKRIISC